MLTGVQSAWDIGAALRRVTACDTGLTPARAVQGRDAEQAGASGHLRHSISYPPRCLAEDGDLKHILIPTGRGRNYGREKRAGFALSSVAGAIDGWCA